MNISLLGLFFSFVLYAESLRPSLLPLSFVNQIVFTGIVSALGYDLGIVCEAFLKRFAWYQKIPSVKTMRFVIFCLLALLFILATYERLGWQKEQRSLLGVQGSSPHLIALLLGSLGIVWVTLKIGKGIRITARRISSRFHNQSSKTLLSLGVGLLVAGVGYIFFSLSIFGLEIMLALRSSPEPLKVEKPVSSARSGGQNSPVAWERLGQKGKEFVSVDSSAKGNILEPIRVYVSIENEPNLEKRVNMVLQELERTLAFERKALVIFTPTGSGWVNPVAVNSAEHSLNGDVASVAMQYSSKASVVQYIVDRNLPQKATSLLISKVRAKLNTLDPNHRPKLYLYGESLGSLASQEYFVGKSINDISRVVDGALWVGPPSASSLWSQFEKEGLFHTDHTETVARIGPMEFLYNATDPVVLFNRKLIYQSPKWLQIPRARYIDAHMQWRPVLTFLHISFEMISGNSFPSGVGHTYTSEIPGAMARMLQ